MGSQSCGLFLYNEGINIVPRLLQKTEIPSYKSCRDTGFHTKPDISSDHCCTQSQKRPKVSKFAPHADHSPDETRLHKRAIRQARQPKSTCTRWKHVILHEAPRLCLLRRRAANYIRQHSLLAHSRRHAEWRKQTTANEFWTGMWSHLFLAPVSNRVCLCRITSVETSTRIVVRFFGLIPPCIFISENLGTQSRPHPKKM